MRIRQHVNPLKSDFLRIPVERLASPPGVPVEVELGSAEAYFLMDRARDAPAGLYVGVEIRREMVAKANAECAARGLGGVRCVYANMSQDLPRLFSSGQIARFFLNFPDPYWKSKQHKRRVITPELVMDVSRALAVGGEFYVATDIFELALEAMAVLETEAAGSFSSLVEPWSFLASSPFAARSRRELQCESEGARIWRLGYRRV